MSSSTCSSRGYFCTEHVQRTSFLRGYTFSRMTDPRFSCSTTGNKQVLCTYLVSSFRSCSSTAVQELVGLFFSGSFPLETERSHPGRLHNRNMVSVLICDGKTCSVDNYSNAILNNGLLVYYFDISIPWCVDPSQSEHVKNTQK